MIAGLVLVALLVAFVVRRRRRAVMLAGLTGERPAFTVEPPRRHLSSLRNERL